MAVHHLNCGSSRPRVLPASVSHVLLVERSDGLLLVDSGLGSQDLADPARLGRAWTTTTRPSLDPEETALAQVRSLGYTAENVTDIAVTHLDLDHAGGLGDFPRARVHVQRTELDAAAHPRRREKGRYLAAQWGHDPQWVTHEHPADDWFGFSATALDDDLVLVPLIGHTRGHMGVAVRDATGRWLLHAGDAFLDGRQVQTPSRCHPGAAVLQRMIASSNRSRRDNTERLRELAATHPTEITVFCAHDRAQFETLASA